MDMLVRVLRVRNDRQLAERFGVQPSQICKIRKRKAVISSAFLINIVVKDDDDRTPDRICWRLRETFGTVRLLDTDGWDDRNAIACAGAVRGLTRPRLLMPPRSGAKALAAELRLLDFRALRV